MTRTSKYHYIAAAGFIFFSIIFFFCRLKNLYHPLMWDEAWNIMSLRAVLAGTEQDPFYWYYYFHPPLYTLFARILFPFARNFAFRAAFLSLVFSYGTFTVVYFFCRRLGGIKYAWASGFFLSVLPASICYDTWIKRDSLAAFLGYGGLFLIFKKKYIPASLLLGLSLLSKETGMFFILTGFICMLLTKGPGKIRHIIVSAVIITILNAWWYLYMSTFTGNLFSYYLSGNTPANIVRDPSFTYYFRKLPLDCGWVPLFFFISGLFSAGYALFFKKHMKWMYPMSIILCVYLPLSFVIKSKAPWQMISGIPAIAMICGAGLIFIIKKLRKTGYLRTAVLLVLIIPLLSGLALSYEGYHSTSYPNGWPGAKASKTLAIYLNRNMSPGDKVLISDFSYWNEKLCPIFTYYLNGREIIMLQEKDLDNIPFIEESIDKLGIDWLVIPFSPDNDVKRHNTARKISKKTGIDPAQIGWAYIWDMRGTK